MKKSLFTLLIALALIVGFTMAAPVQAADKNVKLVYVEWDCATAATHVVKAVLEDMGYKVETIPVAAAAMWQAMGTGDAEGMVCAWLPVTHADYLAKVKDNVADLGPNTEGAKIGWVVPKYVTINSIEEMNANKDKFDGKVIGIDPGAGLMKKSEIAIKDYGLDFELIEGSGATMTAALADAIKNKKWVVVAGWSPHWKFGRWDLKYLDDPKGVFGAEETINTIVRKDLKKDMPEVYTVLDNFHWSADTLQKIMAQNQEKGADPDTTAKKWVKENPDMVKKWKGQ
jgi:glycine betaine/proline transport system substrate-binding protein